MFRPAAGGPSTLDLLAMVSECNKKIEALRTQVRELSDLAYNMWRFEGDKEETSGGEK